MNKLITSTENKFVNVIKKKKKTANKATELDAFYVGTLLNIHRIKPIFLNLFPRWKKMGHSKIHPMRLATTLIPKPDNNYKKIYIYKPISLMNIHMKVPNKISAN